MLKWIVVLFCWLPLMAEAVEEYQPIMVEGGAVISIDGGLEDWEIFDLSEGKIDRFIPLGGMRPPRDEEDLSATFRCVVDEGALYFAVRVRDDHLIFGEDAYIRRWNDDAVEILFDGNRSASDLGPDGGDGQIRVPFDTEKPLCEGVAGRTMQLVDYLPPLAWERLGVEAAVAQEEDGYTVEIRIPCYLLGLERFGEGVEIGVNLRVMDDDDGGGMDRMIDWAGDRENLSADLKTANFGVLRVSGQVSGGGGAVPEQKGKRMWDLLGAASDSRDGASRLAALDESELLPLRAALLRRAGDSAGALELLDALLQQAPGEVVMHWVMEERMTNHLALGESGRTAARTDGLGQQESAELLMALGHASRRKGAFSEAIAYYRQILERGESWERAQAQYQIASCYGAAGENEQAREEYARLQREYAGNGEAMAWMEYGLAMLERSEGNVNGAQERLKGLLSREGLPDNVRNSATLILRGITGNRLPGLGNWTFSEGVADTLRHGSIREASQVVGRLQVLLARAGVEEVRGAVPALVDRFWTIKRLPMDQHHGEAEGETMLAIISLLSKIGDVRSQSALIEGLMNGGKAARGLAQIGRGVVPDMLDSLGSERERMRHGVAFGLQRMAELEPELFTGRDRDRIRERLVAALERATVKSPMLRALGIFGDATTLSVLEQVAENGSLTIGSRQVNRMAATAAVEQLRERLGIGVYEEPPPLQAKLLWEGDLNLGLNSKAASQYENARLTRLDDMDADSKEEMVFLTGGRTDSLDGHGGHFAVLDGRGDGLRPMGETINSCEVGEVYDFFSHRYGAWFGQGRDLRYCSFTDPNHRSIYYAPGGMGLPIRTVDRLRGADGDLLLIGFSSALHRTPGPIFESYCFQVFRFDQQLGAMVAEVEGMVSGHWPTIVAADFDEDGTDEVALASRLGDSASFYYMDPDEGWKFEQFAHVGAGRLMGAGDVDRDGRVELLAGGYGYGEHQAGSWCFELHAGTWVYDRPIQFPSGGNWPTIGLGDVLGDAELELVCRRQGQVRIYGFGE
jgi:tetratricopeptide (TPR) repeat protein